MKKMIVPTTPKEIKIEIHLGTCCPNTWKEFILLVRGLRMAAKTKEKTKYIVMLEKYQPTAKSSKKIRTSFGIGFFIG